MRTNKLVWLGVAILLVGVVVVGINAFNNPSTKKTDGQLVSTQQTDTKVKKGKEAAKPKQVEVKEVAGDTVAESLKDVQVRYEASEKKNMTLEQSIKTLNERLAKTESRIGAGQKGDERVNEVASEVDAIKGSFANLAQQFSTQEERLKTTSANGYDFSNEDLGIDGKTKGDRKGLVPSQTTLLQGYVAVKPLSASSGGEFGGAINNTLRNMDGLASQHLPEQDGAKPALKDKKKKGVITPHYTIPARSTLMDAAAMTAMIGRVPVGGRVQDPFPVKFILGDDNLATNGLTIPGLKGIVFEGVATGNWNLSCVSVELTGATFTFLDDRVQHLPNKDKTEFEGKQDGQLETDPMASSSGGGRSGLNPIGYISDPQGVPCIGGKRITDAPQQLATIGVLGAAKAYFDAKANAETTNTTNLLGGSQSTVTGDQIKFANNATAAGSVQTVMDFYKSRTRDSFDVIFVNPGADVALHITRDLYVDYNTGSRKLVYLSGGNQHGSSMD